MHRISERIGILPRKTRFRVYQMDGISYSYFDGTRFTLVNARFTNQNRESLETEIKCVGKSMIDTLHITSWDKDYCDPDELGIILIYFWPNRIEYPSTEISTQSAKDSFEIINDYRNRHKGIELIQNRDKYYLLDSGSFSILNFSNIDKNMPIHIPLSLAKEADILILPDHESHETFFDNSYIRIIKPCIGIRLENRNVSGYKKNEPEPVNHENTFDIISSLREDIIIESVNNHRGEFKVISKNNNENKGKIYISKKFGNFLIHQDNNDFQIKQEITIV